MKGLLLHGDSRDVAREDLKLIHTPMPTPTWKPVPHYEVTELVRDTAEFRGFNIQSEAYGLNPSGTKMFGVLRFHPEGHPEHTRALGIRNSHDKSFALGLTVGLSVLVCDNLCFGGETVLKRKHTSRIDPACYIPESFDAMTYQYAQLEANVDNLKLQSMSMDSAKILIVEAAQNKIISSCDIVPVLNEYEEPQHDEFLERNRWSLYNAFTEVAKKYSPTKADKCYRGLSQMFALVA